MIPEKIFLKDWRKQNKTCQFVKYTNMKTRKEEPENIYKKLKKKRKMKDDTNTFFYWLFVLGLLNDLLCCFFNMFFWIVILVVTVILLVKSTWGRVLHYVIVTDYEIGKEENGKNKKTKGKSFHIDTLA